MKVVVRSGNRVLNQCEIQELYGIRESPLSPNGTLVIDDLKKLDDFVEVMTEVGCTVQIRPDKS